MPTTTDRWVDVGVLGRAHGIKGELYAHLHNAESRLLTEGRRFRVGDSQDAAVVTVARARRVARGWLVTLLGVDQREAAAALTNHKLYVQRTELPELDDDEVYQDDLVGLSAVTADGRELGVVVGFFYNGAHDVCVVRTPSGDEALLPFHDDALIDVRFDDHQVVLDVPDGLPGLSDDAGGAAEGE